MRKLLLLLSLLIVIPFVAQDVNNEIKSQFNDYNQLIIEKKFDQALDVYGNEDFFKVVPKDQIVSLMNQMFNAPEIDIKIEKPENIIINEDPIKVEENIFVEISYQQDLQMKFNGKEVSNEVLLTALEKEFGHQNVNFNQQTGFFLINANKTVVANSKDSKNWKFTVLEKKQIPILRHFIPAQFLKNLK